MTYEEAVKLILQRASKDHLVQEVLESFEKYIHSIFEHGGNVAVGYDKMVGWALRDWGV